MRTHDMILPATPRTVRVTVGRGVLSKVLDPLPRWSRTVLIADRAVHRAFPEPLLGLAAAAGETVAEPILLDAGEGTKDAARLAEHWTTLASCDLDRGGGFVVAGGGSTLDLGAFLAATWLRGLPLVAVPTTLLAQVDAGLGGKCGVNLHGAKNQVGAIWQPEMVLCDLDLLGTLPDAEWASGMGEVVKTAVLAGGDLLVRTSRLDQKLRDRDPGLEDVIFGCLSYKAAVVADDEREAAGRAVLNLGHTVGHVIESLALEQGLPCPHGVAVAVGIRAEAAAFSDAAVLDTIDGLLSQAGLPNTVPVQWDDTLGRELLWRDKKRRGKEITVPLLDAPGEPRLRVVPEESLLDACRRAAGG